MTPKAAFTKKDLIVTLGCVVFLLANLAAIGGGGRKRAKQAVCLSNLRQWGICYSMYANDNDGSLPRGDDHGQHPEWMWVYSLHTYYKKGQLRLCPSATSPYFMPCTRVTQGGAGTGPGRQPFASFGPLWGQCAVSWGDNPNFTWTYYTDVINGGNWEQQVWDGSDSDNYLSYGSSEYVWGAGEDSAIMYSTPNVKGADKVPVLMDCSFYCGNGQATDDPPAHEADTWWGGSQRDEMKRFCLNRHNGAMNGLFLDFSARSIGLKELWALKWHKQYDTEGLWTIAGGVQPTDWPQWMRDFKDY